MNPYSLNKKILEKNVFNTKTLMSFRNFLNISLSQDSWCCYNKQKNLPRAQCVSSSSWRRGLKILVSVLLENLTGTLTEVFFFDWVGIFRKIWISTHWFKKLLIPCSSFFSLNIQYWRFRYCNFSFRVNKFFWNCLMKQKILLINGAKEKKKKFLKKILYMKIVLFINWRHFVANYFMYEMFQILLAGRNRRNPKLSWKRGVLRFFCPSRKAA